jgi:thiamine-phosphate pyrophosphorylase
MRAGERPLGRLYLVATPRPRMTEQEFLTRVSAALDGGVDVLQLRCKDTEALPFLRLAERVCELARDRGVPFIVNDRPDVALAVEADGVHLGQADIPVEWARRILRNKIIGRSSHEPVHAMRAVDEQADYFAVGPVWETPTKPGRAAAGISYVHDVVELAPRLPWFAIGGITLDNVREVLDAGARRIAVVRAILDARDPAAASAAFSAVLANVNEDLGMPKPSSTEAAWS